MTLTRDRSNPSRQYLQHSRIRDGTLTSHSPSQTSSAGAACSSSSSCGSRPCKTGTSGTYIPTSPSLPPTDSYGLGSRPGTKSPIPTFDVARAAVRGTSNNDTQYDRIKEVYRLAGAAATPLGVAHLPFREGMAHVPDVTNVRGQDFIVKGAAKHDIASGKELAAGGGAMPNARIIGVDFDDVCSQYIPKLAAEHNAKYGTDITPDDFKTYVFFQNRGWGTPAETQRKLDQLEKDTALAQVAPVPGFAAALRVLKALGHPIHIVTARAEPFKPSIEIWLEMHGITIGDGPNDTITAVWCCSSYTKNEIPEMRPTVSGIADEEELNERLLGMFGRGKSGMSKLKVLRSINASLLIDDNHGNLEPIVSSEKPIPCLLFGDYPWNRSRSGFSTPGELMTFEQRMKAGLDITVEDIEMGLYLHRVKGWADVVEWVKIWDAQATEVTPDLA